MSVYTCVCVCIICNKWKSSTIRNEVYTHIHIYQKRTHQRDFVFTYTHIRAFICIYVTHIQEHIYFSFNFLCRDFVTFQFSLLHCVSLSAFLMDLRGVRILYSSKASSMICCCCELLFLLIIFENWCADDR